LAALGSQAKAQTYGFSPFVGNASVLDHTNGTGGNARFFNPTSVAVDSSGNIYVADGGDHTIRKVSASGTVTTLAGNSGQAGSTDGTGSGALFLYPFAVAVDSAGNVYVADSGNQNIRRITPGGTVTTLAGTAGVEGSTDGTANGALFNQPQGIAVDATGNIYVSDTNNCTIRKVTQAGVTTTIAGAVGQSGAADGTGGSARFAYPIGIATDASGNVYVADLDNSAVRKVTPTGVVSTIAGDLGSSGTLDGQGTSARFNHPSAVALDAAGNVYVVDTSNQTIREISVAGNVTTLAGTPGIGGRSDGSGAGATFFYPAGIAATASGVVYIADTGNHSIRAMVSPGVVTTLAGSVGQKGSADGTGSAATFAYPYGVAIANSGVVYIADSGNNTIRVASSGGSVTTFAGTAGVAGSADGQGAAASFNDPTGVAVDGSGNVFVADTGNSVIRRISPGGTVTTFAGAAGSTGSSDGTGSAARFNAPSGIAIDTQNNVYVADTRNNTIRKITSGGTVSTLAGSGGVTGSGDGAGGSARFNGPYAVAVDSFGNLYVSDFFNGTIRKIDTSNTVTTLAGSAGNLGFADGAAGAARFNQPYGVAVDGSDNVYVADTYNRAIRKVTPSGTVTTLNGTETRFLYPQGIAMSSSGTIYVADGDNQDVSSGGVLSAPPSGTQVSNSTVTAGQSASFNISVTGSPVTYQWQESVDGGITWNNVSDSSTFSGSATATLTVSGTVSTMSGDEFRAQLSNAAGSSVSGAGTLTVSGGGGGGGGGIAVSGSARLINISTRAVVGTGANILIPGFVISGSGNETLLIRADGPSLAAFGVGGTLAQPVLQVFDASGNLLASNTGWGTSSNSAQIASVSATVGAFAFTAGSADSAVLITLPAGAYTVHISGVNNGTGVALAEVYEVASTGTRLGNISTRASVGTGANIEIAGFVIEGTGTDQLLIRADGPVLSQFSVSGVLAQPVLSLMQGSTTVDSNTGWGNSAAITTATAQAQTFQFPSGSADSALVENLPAGSYTAQISGVNSTTGVALAEVYEVP
jgi:sugar lactone lactonase YvrE